MRQREYMFTMTNAKLWYPLFCMALFLFCQRGICQRIVNSAGKTVQDNNINIEYSIGEIAITTISSPANYVTQGLLQPSIKLGNATCTIIDDTVNFFPNPAENILRVVAHQDWITAYRIYAADGKLLRVASFFNNQINMYNLPRGIYFIKLYPGCDDKFRILKVVKQ